MSYLTPSLIRKCVNILADALGVVHIASSSVDVHIQHDGL